MTPTIDPGTVLPVLHGVGVNVRAAVPGYHVLTADGRFGSLLGEGIAAYEVQRDGDWVVFADDLPPEGVLIPREEVVAKAAALANYIAATVRDARRAYQVLDDAILPANDVEAQANTIANTDPEADGRGDQ